MNVVDVTSVSLTPKHFAGTRVCQLGHHGESSVFCFHTARQAVANSQQLADLTLIDVGPSKPE